MLWNTWQFMQTPGARAVLLVAIMLTLSVIGWYAVRRFRDQISGDGDTTYHLTKFREMEQQGVLSDAEFRTIKTVLGSHVSDELTEEEQPS